MFSASKAALLLCVALASSADAQPDSLFRVTRPAMGSTFEISLYARDSVRAAELFDEAFDEVERLEALLSNYRPSSELSRLNASASGEPVTTDPEMYAFLERALEYSRRTSGAFDMTVGRLMEAWGFFRGSGHYPTDSALDHARAQTGWRNVQLDSVTRTVHFRVAGLRLDPGGIGKGYAVDRVAELLRHAGVTAALIGSGTSSYYGLGAPPGKDGWLVRIPDPFDTTRLLSVVNLRDLSLSTSGCSQKFFVLEGRSYCHIMDPRTGKPVQGMVQVTVLTPLATDSDALSTAVFVLGQDAGRAVLRQMAATSALFVQGSRDKISVTSFNWPAPVSAGGAPPGQ